MSRVHLLFQAVSPSGVLNILFDVRLDEGDAANDDSQPRPDLSQQQQQPHTGPEQPHDHTHNSENTSTGTDLNSFLRQLLFLSALQRDEQTNMGPPPASQTAIERLVAPSEEVKRALLEEASKCLVCQMPYEDTDEFLELPCTHVFHPSCVKPWLQMHNTCPLCRFELDVDNDEFNAAIRARRGQNTSTTPPSAPQPSATPTGGPRLPSPSTSESTSSNDVPPRPQTSTAEPPRRPGAFPISSELLLEMLSRGEGQVHGNLNDSLARVLIDLMAAGAGAGAGAGANAPSNITPATSATTPSPPVTSGPSPFGQLFRSASAPSPHPPSATPRSRFELPTALRRPMPPTVPLPTPPPTSIPSPHHDHSMSHAAPSPSPQHPPSARAPPTRGPDPFAWPDNLFPFESERLGRSSPRSRHNPTAVNAGRSVPPPATTTSASSAHENPPRWLSELFSALDSSSSSSSVQQNASAPALSSSTQPSARTTASLPSAPQPRSLSSTQLPISNPYEDDDDSSFLPFHPHDAERTSSRPPATSAGAASTRRSNSSTSCAALFPSSTFGVAIGDNDDDADESLHRHFSSPISPLPPRRSEYTLARQPMSFEGPMSPTTPASPPLSPHAPSASTTASTSEATPDAPSVAESPVARTPTTLPANTSSTTPSAASTASTSAAALAATAMCQPTAAPAPTSTVANAASTSSSPASTRATSLDGASTSSSPASTRALAPIGATSSDDTSTSSPASPPMSPPTAATLHESSRVLSTAAVDWERPSHDDLEEILSRYSSESQPRPTAEAVDSILNKYLPVRC